MSNKIRFLLNRVPDAFFLNISVVANILSRAITLPIILPNLPIEDYGLLQFVMALEIWFAIFTVPHVSSGAKRGIARGLEGTLLFSYLVRLPLFLFASLFICITAIVLRIIGGFEILSILLFLFSGLLLLGTLSQETWRQFLVAKKKFRQYAFWRSITLVLTPIGGAIAAVQTHSIIAFALVQFGLSALLSITAFIYVVWKHDLVFSYKEGHIDKEIVGYGIRMLPVSFAQPIAEKGAALIIGPFFGFTNLAMFAVADKMTEFFRTFLKSSYSLFYADFSKLYWGTLVRKMKEHFSLLLFFSIIISIPFILVGYFYIHFFLPESYQLVKLYLLILGLGLPPIVFKNIIQAMLESDFRSREILFLSVVPNIIRLSSFIIGGLLFGIMGIIWAIVLSAWVESGFYYFMVTKSNKKETKNNYLILFATYWNERYFIEPSLRQIEALNPKEIFICDGCFEPGVLNKSTDGTHEIIEKFVETHPNVHLISALRPGFFKTCWLLLRGHKHLPWWTIFRPVRWKFLIISFGKVAYRRNQAITFNHMVSLSKEWKSGAWFMPYDADQFYSDEMIEKIKQTTSNDNDFDLITGDEITFFAGFNQYTTDYDSRHFSNMPHRVYEDTLFQPTRSMIRETKSGKFSIFNFRKTLAKHLYIYFVKTIAGGNYFHYKLNSPERLKAGYELGDRGTPNPEKYQMKEFKGKHPKIIQDYFNL